MVFFRVLGHTTSFFGDRKGTWDVVPSLRGHSEDEEGRNESSSLVTGAVCYIEFCVTRHL